MQNKCESKSRLAQYSSIRQYDSSHPNPKKKQPTKSNKKHKPHLSTQSHSKSKLQPNSNLKNNQNINSINIPLNPNPKFLTNQHHIFKKDGGDNRLKRNSSEKLIKTKSTSKLQLKSQRRESPIPLVQNCEQRPKISRNGTSCLERKKKSKQQPKQQGGIKKSGSKMVLPKCQPIERTARNRPSIKTQMSSKTHSVIKEEERRKPKKEEKGGKGQVVKSQRSRPFKIPKSREGKIGEMQRSILYSQVSFQQYHGEHPYQSAFVSNDKYFLPYPDPKSIKTQGCQLDKSLREPSNPITDTILQTAAVSIQRVFRGYITRKYIEQAKYIIGKVKIIQIWWRRIGRKLRAKKISSVTNSLITIRDFSDTLRTDRNRPSESKQNTLSNQKQINLKELIKNILQQNQEEEEEQAQSEKNLSKDVYIELKIQEEIKSQRKFNFNSPRSLPSPSLLTPTNNRTLRDLFDSSTQKQKIKDRLLSPPPPQQPKNTPHRSPPQPSTSKQSPIPFDSSFSTIQQFCFLLVSYFRDKPHQMHSLVTKLDSLKQFRTLLILKGWNNHTLSSHDTSFDSIPADYEFLEGFQKPLLFNTLLRNDMLNFPEIQIDLSVRGFNFEAIHSTQIHRTFLQFAFDVLEEAFYQQHKGTVLKYGMSLSKYIFPNQQSLFEHYLSSALGELFRWGQLMCGMIEEVPQQEMNREERLRQLLRRIQVWDNGLSQQLAVKVETSEYLLMDLFEEAIEEVMKAFL